MRRNRRSPRSRLRIRIRKETRMLGAIQIMTGLILHWLGMIWAYLLVTQLLVFGKSYLPLSALTGYPFWSSFSFILTGVFTVIFEKRRSRLLIHYTIIVNIISACIAVVGLFLLLLEFSLFQLSSTVSIWPHRSGLILSQYLFLFILVELFVACTVIHWVYKAKYRR